MMIDSRGLQPSANKFSSIARRADIQGLRAIAVLLVVAFHAKLPVPGGFVGVDVFFVISGFVITAMLMRQWMSTGFIDFRSFYFRRFLRLTPALALLVTVVAAASILLQNPYGAQQTSARTGIGAMLLTANVAIAHGSGDYFASGALNNPLLHTWSLSVEEQFYLAFPALLVLGWLLSRRLRRRLLASVVLVALIAAGSFDMSVVFSYGSAAMAGLTGFFGGPESLAFYSPFARAWEFAAGALLALVVERLGTMRRSVAMLTGVVGAVLLGLSALFITEEMAFPGFTALLPVAGTVLLLLAGAHHTAGVNAVLSTRPFVEIGDVSYSWYLWHWPIIVFTALLFPGQRVLLVIAAAASLIPAIASYLLLEQPMRCLSPRSRRHAAAVIVATLAIPILACTVLLAGANAGWGLAPDSRAEASTTTGGQPLLQDMAVADDAVANGEGGKLRARHIAVRARCVNTSVSPRRCTFGPANSIGTVILAGDSHSYALADGVVAAAAQLGYRTLVTSRTGCPFLARESSGVHKHSCSSWQKSVLAYALKTRPTAVLIGNLSEGYVHPENDARTAVRDDGGRAGSVDEAASLWRAGLDPVVSTLRDAGIGVVIITSVPKMTGYTDGTSLLSQAIGSPDFSISRENSEKRRLPALTAERAVAKANPGTVVFDPNPALCDDDVCWAVRDGEVLYQDETHLSVEGSVLLVHRLRAAMTQAGMTPGP